MVGILFLLSLWTRVVCSWSRTSFAQQTCLWWLPLLSKSSLLWELASLSLAPHDHLICQSHVVVDLIWWWSISVWGWTKLAFFVRWWWLPRGVWCSESMCEGNPNCSYICLFVKGTTYCAWVSNNTCGLLKKKKRIVVGWWVVRARLLRAGGLKSLTRRFFLSG